MEPRLTSIFVFFVFFCATSVYAESSDRYVPIEDQSADFQVKVLLDDLDNPAGIAVRPTRAKRGPYELYLAESGAGRVLRVGTDSPELVEEVIRDFPLGTLGQEPAYRVGPLGLAFLDRRKLVVGMKGVEEKGDRLAGFILNVGDPVITAAAEDFAAGPLKSGDAKGIDDLHFLELALADKTLFLTTGGLDSQGMILKSPIEANRLAYLQPFLDLKKVADFGAPGGIAMIPPPRPAFLVVGLMGSRETPHDSRLVFFVPATGEMALSLPTGLHDIVSLAYSPTGQLYAADFSWQDEQAGGVYRIDEAQIEGRQTCRAVKIASLVRPMSLMFTPDGVLYATALGEGENTKQGTLVKITGDL